MDNKHIPNIIDERTIDYNYNDVQKMLFIFNALQDGWTVKKIDTNKFEFIKDNENIKKEIILDECIKKYMKYNISNK